MKILYGILLIFLMAGVSYATSAAIQVSSYSTVPAMVYPGTSGQLQVTLLNSGTDAATNVALNYKTAAQSEYSQINPGDIGAGSTATVSLPFQVPQNVSSGFFMMYINVYYYDSSSAASKNTPLSVPIVVSQHQILEVNTGSITPETIGPGDPVSVVLQIINTGGTMNAVTITTPANSSFTLEGTTQLAVGDVPYNGTKNVTVNLRSSSLTTTGRYTIPISISYQDSLQNTVTQTAYVGPVAITESSAQFRVYLTPLAPTEVGSQVQFALTLENLGGSSSSAIVDINQGGNVSAIFTPIGTTKVYFDSIEPGQNATQVITLGIGATTVAGYYNLPLTINANGNSYVQNLGIVVDATPEVTISTSTQPQFISSGSTGVTVLVQIANTGNGPIRSVYSSSASTDAFSITGGSDKFIGTLNVDDSATFQLTINVKGKVNAGTYPLPITISFKDSTNQQHAITKDVELTVYSSTDAATFGAAGNSGGTRGARNGGGLFGLGLIPTIIIAIVIICLGFFGYRKYIAKPKKV